LLTQRPNQELSEAEKKKQKEYQEAIARESDKLAPTAKEHDKDKRLRDAKEKRRRDSIVGIYNFVVGGKTREDETALFYMNGRGELKRNGFVIKTCTWTLNSGEIYFSDSKDATIVFNALANGDLISIAEINPLKKRSEYSRNMQTYLRKRVK